MICQSTIEENIDKRGLFKEYCPTGGRKLIVFINDMHMPNVDIYRTQQPIAFLKFLIDRGTIYERNGDLYIKKIVDVQYIGSMAQPGGDNANVDPKFLALFSTLTLLLLTESSVELIYTEILEKHLQARDHEEELLTTIPVKMTRATILVYNQICESLPRNQSSSTISSI